MKKKYFYKITTVRVLTVIPKAPQGWVLGPLQF